LQSIDHKEMKKILIDIADRIMLEKDALTKLDASCGDGDLGVVMYIAFKRARDKIQIDESGDVGSLLATLGSEILSSAGGASGPLFGTIFREAGKIVKMKKRVTLEELTEMFEESLSNIKKLGGAKVGDKTLIDALEPAVKSLRKSLNNKQSLENALSKAAEEAELGTKMTRNMVARHGKARYLGKKSIGYLDPGAKIIELIFKTMMSSYNSLSSCPV